MTVQATVSPDERTVTVRVPLTIRKRGGRKQVLAPDGTVGWLPRSARVDSTLVKALARAHRWKRMLESGSYGTVAELAAAERINPSYLSRVLRLTLLAPEIVEAILNGTQPGEITLDRLMDPFPVEWEEQRSTCGRLKALPPKSGSAPRAGLPVDKPRISGAPWLSRLQTNA